jgi:3-dehydroquinate synthetase
LAEIDPAALASYIGHDKKKSSDGICWVLPTDTGIVLDQKVATVEALEVFEDLKEDPIQRD